MQTTCGQSWHGRIPKSDHVIGQSIAVEPAKWRRQVFGAARQMLSLVAGGKIDEWLLGHLRGLRDEHFVARMLHALESMLWPGGVWFLHSQQTTTQVINSSPNIGCSNVEPIGILRVRSGTSKEPCAFDPGAFL